MQESRLFRIIYHLLDKGQATAPELAEKFEVSVRTIYRDIDALSAAGIPVYTETGRNGGIRLLNDFVLERAVLSGEEKQEILSALQSLSAVQSGRDSKTLDKLSALFSAHPGNWLEVDFSRWGSGQRDNDRFEELKAAILSHREVKITYAGSSETIGERIVRPMKLVYKSRAWYLNAFCMEKQDNRLFKLTRILEWEVLESSFLPGAVPKQRQEHFLQYPQIILRFPEEVAYRVYDEFDRANVTRQENGDLLVCAHMPEDTWLTGYLLSFGTCVEVVEPVHLKSILAQQARLIYEKNKP